MKGVAPVEVVVEIVEVLTIVVIILFTIVLNLDFDNYMNIKYMYSKWGRGGGRGEQWENILRYSHQVCGTSCVPSFPKQC